MYICICKAITDKQMEEAQKTSRSFKEVCAKLGIGSECGSCLQDAINEHEKIAAKNTNKQTSLRRQS